MTTINFATEDAIHQGEITEIERQENSPEFRALCIKNAGQAIAEYGETLRLAALGQLTVAEPDIFGEIASIEQQVFDAKICIKRHFDILAKYA